MPGIDPAGAVVAALKADGLPVALGVWTGPDTATEGVIVAEDALNWGESTAGLQPNPADVSVSFSAFATTRDRLIELRTEIIQVAIAGGILQACASGVVGGWRA